MFQISNTSPCYRNLKKIYFKSKGLVLWQIQEFGCYKYDLKISQSRPVSTRLKHSYLLIFTFNVRKVFKNEKYTQKPEGLNHFFTI